jgi:hypothetical protein
VLLLPLDRRLPKIRVKTRNWAGLAGRRVLVALDAWELRSRLPRGHVTRVLAAQGEGGDSSGDLKADVEAMLLKNSIYPRPFSLEAMACLPDLSHVEKARLAAQNLKDHEQQAVKGGWQDSHWRIPEGGMAHRLDLRAASAQDLAALISGAGAGGTDASVMPSTSPTADIPTSFDPVVPSAVNAGTGASESVRIFSVDPQGCQDIDDAMSVTALPASPGTPSFLLGIHIADVTAFVPEGCALVSEWHCIIYFCVSSCGQNKRLARCSVSVQVIF